MAAYIIRRLLFMVPTLLGILLVSFVVPSGCVAQRLELSGSASDVPQTSDVSISGLNLIQQRSGG